MPQHSHHFTGTPSESQRLSLALATSRTQIVHVVRIYCVHLPHAQVVGGFVYMAFTEVNDDSKPKAAKPATAKKDD